VARGASPPRPAPRPRPAAPRRARPRRRAPRRHRARPPRRAPRPARGPAARAPRAAPRRTGARAPAAAARPPPRRRRARRVRAPPPSAAARPPARPAPAPRPRGAPAPRAPAPPRPQRSSPPRPSRLLPRARDFRAGCAAKAQFWGEHKLGRLCKPRLACSNRGVQSAPPLAGDRRSIQLQIGHWPNWVQTVAAGGFQCWISPSPTIGALNIPLAAPPMAEGDFSAPPAQDPALPEGFSYPDEQS